MSKQTNIEPKWYHFWINFPAIQMTGLTQIIMGMSIYLNPKHSEARSLAINGYDIWYEILCIILGIYLVVGGHRITPLRLQWASMPLAIYLFALTWQAIQDVSKGFSCCFTSITIGWLCIILLYHLYARERRNHDQ